MLYIKKVFNLKIIPLFLAVFFFFNSAAYGLDFQIKSSLRYNILSNTEEGRGRLKDGFGYVSNLKGWPNNIYERAGKSFREGHDTYSRSWVPHIKNNKKNILRACSGLKGGTAILLGAGESLSVPLQDTRLKG